MSSSTTLPANTNPSTPIFLLSNISTYVTVKLDHSNFLTWKFQITHILEAYSLLEYVEGYNTCPPKFLADELGAITTQVNSVYSQWQARDKALMSLISATLSSSAHSLIIGQTSAYGMWNVLLKRHTSVSRSNILNLKKQLHDVKKNTDTVAQYLQRIKESKDRLAAVGTLVDDEDLLHIVLKGLPSEYESFSTAMLTKSEPVSFEELHVLMITQEELLKNSQENSKENSIMAMAANKGSSSPAQFNNSAYRGNFQNRGRGSWNSRGRSNNRGGFSSRGGYNPGINQVSNGFPQSFSQSNPNFSPSNPNFSQSQSNPNFSNPNPNRPTCQICYKQGHTALDCYNRMNFSYQGRHPPAKLAAIASAAPPSPSTNCWISDTGATDHFTPDLGNLPDSSIYNDPHLVSVGNGQQLPISHIGNAQLYTSSYLFKLKNILRVPSMASNLLSVNRFCRDNHCAFYFDSDHFRIQDRLTGKHLYKGLSRDGLYPLHGLSLPFNTRQSLSSSSARVACLHSARATSSASSLWHARFGHPQDRVLRHVLHKSPTSPFSPFPQTFTEPIEPNEPIIPSALPGPSSQTLTDHIQPNEPLIPPALPDPPLPNPIPSSSSLAPPPSPTNTHPMVTRSKNGISKKKLLHTTTTKPPPDYLQTEPPTHTVASRIPEWTAAMRDEFDALQRQQTWSLVPPPAGHNIIGCRWVYKLKRTSDGSISRYKARLVAKGFHQKPGLDFDETFSPVVKPPTVRIVLSLAAQHQWPLRQLDISNAFLHGFLKEDVFMVQPPGFVHSALPESSDPSLFVFRQGSTLLYLLLYVDDIILTGNSTAAVNSLITQLAATFELKDLGPLRYFLGLQIDYGTDCLFVHQRKYITDLLSKFNMPTCKAASTPFSISHKLQPSSEAILSDPTQYRSLVGALQYATFTRPDITYAVNQVCQYMHQPTATHFTAAKRILRYLQGTLSLGIRFTSSSSVLTAFTDSDWAGDPFGSPFHHWHHCVPRALASGAAELAWLRQVLCDLGVVLHHAPTMWCDNTSAIALASNPVFHSRTKHIEVDYHFVRERVVRGDLHLQFISTDDQLADLFTKPLSTQCFQRLTSKLMFSTPEH
uniref:Reverse transcriptase Ty1/copia-type domain-containing protein n=1 Tax=Fagus sylvatica TaxID=28930 RepID=A0A2N9ECA1_FAGSY